MAMDIQQWKAKHKHWRDNLDAETESNLGSTNAPLRNGRNTEGCTGIPGRVSADQLGALNRTDRADELGLCVEDGLIRENGLWSTFSMPISSWVSMLSRVCVNLIRRVFQVGCVLPLVWLNPVRKMRLVFLLSLLRCCWM